MLRELACTKCGAPLSPADYAAASTITCPYCEATFVPTSALQASARDAGASAHRLIPLGAMLAGQTFVIEPDTNIGKAPDNTITIEHESLADRHARCVIEGDEVVLIKLASSVAVNRRGAGDRTVLSAGDTVTLGDFDFRYEVAGARPVPAAAGAESVHKLIPLGAMLAGKTFVLGAETSVGRAEDNSIAIEHESLADRHARCEVRADSVVLVNVAASVAVNRRRITAPTPLSPGDTVTIGDFDFRYEVERP